MINFSNVVNQYISYGSFATLRSLASRTFISWVYFDALSGANSHAIFYPLYSTSTNEYWDIGIALTTKKLYTQVGWSAATGAWSTNAAMTTGIHHIGITYSNSSTANDPIFYVDGVAAASTETVAPSGTYKTGTTTTTFIGTTNTGVDKSIDGRIASLCVYNRILTATEIADAYASRKAIPTYQGLVFAPNLLGAAGLQTFDGTTLAGANTIVDNISGAIGTPTGSPVGRGDIYLNY